jgi:hypothetical protein
MVPFIIAIPYLIRFRQCITEYFRVQKANKRTGSINPATGWGGVHLANALKYSTAFPVIILSALQRSRDPSTFGVSEATLFRMWMAAVVINSGYSFYWDVARDWDLTLFSAPQSRNNPEYPWGLRRHRWFHAKEFYYGAIVMDALLRCTWSLKLSPHLDHFNDLEGGIFTMEVLEVLRRWVWIFFRVECEWGKHPSVLMVKDLADSVQCGIIAVRRRTIYCLVMCRTSTTTVTETIFRHVHQDKITMEVLEVFRRWVWIFFRVETEWVRNHRGPAPDDILLGEVGNKYDDSD